MDAPVPVGYRSELLPQLPYWLQAVAGGLEAGALLFVDYGYPRREFYAPERCDGTLRAFHRHRVSGAVFAHPGLQDITASVGFPALSEACHGAGISFATSRSEACQLIGTDHQHPLGGPGGRGTTAAATTSAL